MGCLTNTKSVLIGSGKGGVGKSTVAVNLAIALAAQGLKVGLLDADVYGPSIPIMMGLRRLSPRVELIQGQQKVMPFAKFGIQVMSIGFFVEEARSLIWRGPMVHGTLQKMLEGIAWGDLDCLIVDLPPGTGDVLLSLSQLLKVAGGMVVSTPQEVAMLDAIKALNAFEELNIPLWGVVENMAGFQDPHTGEIHAIFGKGKAQELAERFHAPLLASFPLCPRVCQGGDAGVPCALYQEEQMGILYHAFALRLSQNFLFAEVRNPFQ